jgi:hypothetical protein
MKIGRTTLRWFTMFCKRAMCFLSWFLVIKSSSIPFKLISLFYALKFMLQVFLGLSVLQGVGLFLRFSLSAKAAFIILRPFSCPTLQCASWLLYRHPVCSFRPIRLFLLTHKVEKQRPFFPQTPA